MVLSQCDECCLGGVYKHRLVCVARVESTCTGSRLRLDLGLLLRLLGEEDGVDVGEHAARGDRDAAQQLVQLLVVADGERDVAGDDARLLVVARGVAGELKHLGGEVLLSARGGGEGGEAGQRARRSIKEAGSAKGGREGGKG